MSDPSAIADLVAACQAAPRSAALLRALLAEASGGSAAAALGYLEAADPSPFDAELRRSVADFLSEAGRDAAAGRWRPSRTAGRWADACGRGGCIAPRASHVAPTHRKPVAAVVIPGSRQHRG